MQQMHAFGITALCIKVPQGIKELEDVSPFLNKAVQICNVLGILFNTIKMLALSQDGNVNFYGLRFGLPLNSNF